MLRTIDLLTMLLYIHTLFSQGKNTVFVNCVTVLALDPWVCLLFTLTFSVVQTGCVLCCPTVFSFFYLFRVRRLH